jgi:RNA polymerase sigma factor (sigma-70 family)
VSDKDYEITIKVRNNRLLAKMREAGYKYIPHLAKAAGLSANAVYKIANMRESARSVHNEHNWREPVIKLSEFFRCMPEDIIPVAYRDVPMEKNVARFTMDAGDIGLVASSLKEAATLPFDNMVRDEAVKNLHHALEQILSAREHRVLALRFGLDGNGSRTLEEVGTMLGVQRERIRQIEQNAIGKLQLQNVRAKVREAFHVLCCDGADLPNPTMELETEQRLYSHRLRQEMEMEKDKGTGK